MTDYAAYTFYVNRPELLRRALTSLRITDATIVDNSGNSETMGTFHPPVPLTYAQSMNWMLKDAMEQEADFIIHFHSDAYSENPNAVNELLERVRAFKAAKRKWACAWTFYDILWAINPHCLHDIGGWDTNLPTYFGDQDFRRRAALAGWECIDTHIQGVNHEGSATINSDPKLKFLNGQVFPLHRQYYIQKWGGEPGREVYTKQFNGALEHVEAWARV